MKVLYGYRNLTENLKDPVVAIGIFDGIHIGHKRVIKKLLSLKGAGSDKVVVTFDPHPRTFLNPRERSFRLMSLEHRLSIFKKMGVDAAVVIRFTDFIATMTPEDFIKRVLIKGIGARKVFVGANFHFGRGKTGDVETFKRIGSSFGIDVRIVQPVKRRGRVVSSTWLRHLILKGKLEEAEKLLRRPASVLGTVVGGDRVGTILGIPTANIDPHHEVVPPPGVYAVKVDACGNLFDGVLNMGFKPTFYGSKLKKRREPKIEVHIIDFKGDLYGRNLEIFFIKRLRREKKFKTEEALKTQIRKDARKAKVFLSHKDIPRKILKYKS